MALGGGEAGVDGVARVVGEVDVLFGLGGVFADLVGHGVGGGGRVGVGVVGVAGGDVRSTHASTVRPRPVVVDRLALEGERCEGTGEERGRRED